MFKIGDKVRVSATVENENLRGVVGTLEERPDTEGAQLYILLCNLAGKDPLALRVEGGEHDGKLAIVFADELEAVEQTEAVAA